MVCEAQPYKSQVSFLLPFVGGISYAPCVGSQCDTKYGKTQI